jgi:YcxB-like protein
MALAFSQLYKSWIIWLYYTCVVVCVALEVFSPDSDSMMLMIISIVIFIAIHLRIYAFSRKRYKTSPTIDEEKFWTIDDNGIEIKTISASSSMGWKTIYKVKNDEKWVFIFYNRSAYNYFPKSLLSDFDLSEIRKKVSESRIVAK